MRVLRIPVNSAAEALCSVVNSHDTPFTTAVIRALDSLGLTEKELAALMKLGANQWSAQKAGRGSNYIHVQRLDVLPAPMRDRFIDALLYELAGLRGRTVATPAGHLSHIAAAMRSMSAAVEQLAVLQPSLPLQEERRKAPRHA